jgi:cellulose synthase/poly-beta-1,6-N-acetylglucosamine synthase-like glycosyltransferase
MRPGTLGLTHTTQRWRDRIELVRLGGQLAWSALATATTPREEAPDEFSSGEAPSGAYTPRRPLGAVAEPSSEADAGNGVGAAHTAREAVSADSTVSTRQRGTRNGRGPAVGHGDAGSGDVVSAASTRRELAAVPPSYLVTPFTPDTAPEGLTIRRSRLTTPAMLVAFAVGAALIEPRFPHWTYLYGREIQRLAADPSLRLPKQASIAIRPLFALLLVMFAVFGAGRWRDRLRLAVTSLLVYVPATVAADVALAKLGGVGAPSPFMARGNVIIGVVGILTTALVVFWNARLPAGVTVHRRRGVPRQTLRTAALGVCVVVSAAAVAATVHRQGGHIDELKRIPLLGGTGSVVVLFFAVLPAALCLLGVFARAVSGRVGRRRVRPTPESMCFLVPAHNEEGLIGDCIRSLDQAAAHFDGRTEAIIVENGSTDATPYEAHQAIAGCRHLNGRAITAPPLGKARALNVGLANATADVVVRIDADTLVTPELLRRMAPHFADPRVGGVGVLPLPRNDTGWIGRMRAVETFYGVAFKRAAQSVCDAVTVLPGATVAYRRDILLDLHGFAEGVNGEDADITVRVGRRGYRIVSDSRIRVYTDVPHSLGQLREQRMRWARGLYHMIGRNRSAIWRAQGIRGAWMLPWASFVMFRKLMLIPFACAAALIIAVDPSTLPLREVASAGAILLGVQLLEMAAVLSWYRRIDLVCYVPAYLVFRLLVTYYAVETLLSLSLIPDRSAERVRNPDSALLRPAPAAASATVDPADRPQPTR